MAHKFDPEKMDRLLDPSRRESNDPDRVLELLRLQPGETLADVGSGPGWFTLPLAKRVGPEGRVYALDVEQRMLDRLAERAQAEQLTNIEALVIQEGKAWPVPDARCDAALVANVLHEVEDTGTFISELRRILRREGRVLVIEWRPDGPTDVGPPSHHRLSEQEVRDMMEAGGFNLLSRETVGPHHYGLLFKPGELKPGEFKSS